jgi:hypothetical protein
MPRINNQIRKSAMARALATGATVVGWAKENHIRERTAYRWASSREVIDEVKAIRRAALEQAIGRLSGNANDAAEQINRLAKEAASESVRLGAARAVLAELMTVSSYAALGRRMAEIERRLTAGSAAPVAGTGPDSAGPFGLATTGDGPVGEEDGSCPAS